MKKTVLAAFIFTVFLGSLYPAAAQSPSGMLRLSTSPLPINLKVKPGESMTVPVKIKNDGQEPERLKVDLMKFTADEANGTPLISERTEGDTYFDWVKFSEDNFSVPAGEWKSIDATFTVPQNANLGYYYAIVFTRADKAQPDRDHQTVVAGGTAVLVLLEVDVPNAKREVKLEEFSTDKSMYEFLPTTFTVKLRNTGNVHVAPRGNIFLLKDGQEKEIDIIEVNPNKGSMLPNSPRNYSQDWNNGFPYYVDRVEDNKVVLDADGTHVRDLKWNIADITKLRIGKYTGKLLMVYDDGRRDVPIEAEVSFWVFPWRLILVAIAIPVLPALLIYLLMRRSVKKRHKKES